MLPPPLSPLPPFPLFFGKILKTILSILQYVTDMNSKCHSKRIEGQYAYYIILLYFECQILR